MAPTLQDVSLLLGLPLAGHAIGPLEAPAGWQLDMAQRFGAAFPGAPALAWEHHGPKYDWLLHFQVSSTTSYLSVVVHMVLQKIPSLFTNTFSLLNTDPEVPGVSKGAVECGTDHSQPGGIPTVASRQGDVHREPCHHY
jgi:hypothetical protein